MELRVPGLEDKVALVTGGSSGIGRAACLSFARQGARVAVHYRSGQERAQEVVRHIVDAGGDAVALGADLRFPADCVGLIDRVREHFGRLDILVNNAGDLGPRRSFEEVDEATFDEAIAVNLKAPFFLSQAALPLLEEARDAAVIHVSTTLTYRGSTGVNSHYVTAKGGVNALTLSMANELAARGIRVSCVCPGITDTEMQRRHSTPEQIEKALTRYLIKRMGKPEEVADLIVFLASDCGRYITKEIIVADGGRP